MASRKLYGIIRSTQTLIPQRIRVGSPRSAVVEVEAIEVGEAVIEEERMLLRKLMTLVKAMKDRVS